MGPRPLGTATAVSSARIRFQQTRRDEREESGGEQDRLIATSEAAQRKLPQDAAFAHRGRRAVMLPAAILRTNSGRARNPGCQGIGTDERRDTRDKDGTEGGEAYRRSR